MKELDLQGKERRIQISLSSHREVLVLLNWRRSDYMVKWVVITILLFTVHTLLISTRYFSLFLFLSCCEAVNSSWRLLSCRIFIECLFFFYYSCRRMYECRLLIHHYHHHLFLIHHPHHPQLLMVATPASRYIYEISFV